MVEDNGNYEDNYDRDVYDDVDDEDDVGDVGDGNDDNAAATDDDEDYDE